MQAILYLILILLILVLILFIVILKKDASFRKEFGEAVFLSLLSIKDLKLTDEEKERLKKEWKEVDWKYALKKLIELLKKP